MNDDLTKELTADAVVDNIALMVKFSEYFLEKYGCPREIQLDIDLALNELISNVAFYAYPEEETGKVTVSVSIHSSPREAVISIIDSGIAYNPLEKPDPDLTLSLEDRPIGGLGIYIVKQTMDRVLYRRENDQNILTIIKAF